MTHRFDKEGYVNDDLKPNLGDYLQILSPLILEELVSRQIYCQIHRIASKLPALRTGGFELDLIRSHADFATCLVSNELCSSDRSMLEMLIEKYDSCAWLRLLSTIGLPSIRDQWLEFDIKLGNSELPTPSVFFSTYEPLHASYNGKIPESVHLAIQMLGAHRVPKAVESKLGQIFCALPSLAHISQIGLMLGRAECGLRVIVKNIPPIEIICFLKHLNWHGNFDEIQKAVGYWSQYVDSVLLSIDVGEEIGPRIGLELMFNDYRIGYDARWDRVLSSLQKMELCSARQKEALLNWPGLSTESSSGNGWPIQLTNMASLFPRHCEPVIVRAINHAKVIIENNSIAAVKIYFGFQVSWNINNRLYI